MKFPAAVIGRLILGTICSQAGADVSRSSPILLPTPKQVTWLDGQVSFAAKGKTPIHIVNASGSQAAVETGIAQLNERIRALGGRGIPIVKDAGAVKCKGTIIWVGTRHDLSKHRLLLGENFQLPAEMSVPDGYVLQCTNSSGRDVVICAGYDARGCYYGLQTLIQLTSGKRESRPSRVFTSPTGQPINCGS